MGTQLHSTLSYVSDIYGTIQFKRWVICRKCESFVITAELT